ncbi:MAG: DEAD/DEAH box helicase [Gammaproteobacteria bacterium]|nr:DEAD/DEAH box helicase [Gammaproteobacteria bacterium]MYH45176.1 DEAD/DEAH box helicase [Gammaproteobacteria bacterium]MYL12833.1 DEAD/DEAH box helicase [Gammaproteobacteria bacterium]
MTSFHDLLGEYRKLSEREQFLMRLLAVIYEPATQTDINAAFKALPQTRAETPLHKESRERLLAAGLLRTNRSRWACNAMLAGFLADQAVQRGEFKNMCEQARHLEPTYYYGYRDYHGQQAITKGKLLRALHGSDVDGVMKLLDIADPWETPDAASVDLLVDTCAAPLMPDILRRLAPPLAYQLMRPLLRRGLLIWNDMAPVFRVLQDLAAAADAPAPLLALHAEQCLARGLWKSAQNGAAALEERLGAPLQAAMTFVLGAPDAEVRTAFKQALAAVRGDSRKQTVALPGLSGVAYLLALLREPRPNDPSLWKRQLRAVETSGEDNEFHLPMEFLHWAADILAGRERYEAHSKESARADEFSYLLLALIHYWNGGDPDEAMLKALRKSLDRAQKAGLGWMARETRCLLAAFAGKPAEPADEFGSPLTELVPRTEDWERSLRALALLRIPERPDGTGKKEAETRIAWFVEYMEYDDDYSDFGPSYRYELKPKEQRRGKSGAWSRGRAVSLKRLAENDHSLKLSDADLRICRRIRKYRDYSYYGSGESYGLRGAKALSSAVGHPCVHHGESGERIELAAGKPELAVVEQGRFILLALDPYPDAVAEGGIVVRKSREQWTIYEFSGELRHIATILGKEGLLVPQGAQDKVLESVASVAPLLTIHSDLGGMEESAAEEAPADSRLHVHVRPGGEGLRLSFQVQPIAGGPLLAPGRGGERIFAEVEGKAITTLRELDAEKARLEAVLDACAGLYQTARDNWCWDALEDALEGLLTLKSFGDSLVLHWPEGEALKVTAPVDSSRMSVSLRQHTNWFELNGGLQVDEGQVHSMGALLDLVRNSRGRFVPLEDGQFLTLTEKLRRQLETLGSVAHKGRVNAFGAHALETGMDGMEVDADDGWRSLLERLREARDLDPDVPATVEAELRDYQVAGYKWLRRLAEWGAGACLADDMGLGKTLQALALLVQRAPLGPALVLAPTSVCANWMEEARRFATTLNAIRFGAGERAKTLENLGAFDVLVCSYGLLQSESGALRAVHWRTIVADEAQAFKNAATKRSKAVMALTGDFRMIATGTPVENHLGELWNLFAFVNPGLLGPREAFNEKFAYPIENRNDRQAAAALRQLVRPFILRRLKSEVLAELPPLTEIVVHVELGEEETALYEALRREAVEKATDSDLSPGERRFRALANITRLRRAVCNPNMILKDAKLPSAKLSAFADILDELLENRHRALVFSQFVDHLTLVRAYLDERGVSYRYLDGSTPAARRREEVNAFQSGEADLFLISLKAGGVGLNLTAADYVIHMDPWWNPAVEDQASDRAHRIGQQRPVTVYRLVAANTIEDKIVSLHAHKRDLADRLLEGADSAARMSLDDMLALLES